MENTPTHRRCMPAGTRLPRTTRARIERGRAVVVVANACPVAFELGCGAGRHPVVVPAGQRALICAGSVPAVLEGAVEAIPVPVQMLCRWVAFHDQDGATTEHTTLPAAPLVLFCDDAIDIAQGLGRFLMHLLGNEHTTHERLARQVRASEHYQIARFVLASGASVRVGELARRYGLSSSHFRRRCIEVFGRSAKEQLRELRATQALLRGRAPSSSFADLALASGFASQSHFSDEIKAIVGLAPRFIYKAVHQ